MSSEIMQETTPLVEFFIIRQLSFATKIINGSGMQLFLRIKYIELCPLDMN